MTKTDAAPESTPESAPIMRSPITCPRCGRTDHLDMPSNACVIRHDCSQCGAVLKPQTGDCCVFCSYGIPCPPVQTARGCSPP